MVDHARRPWRERALRRLRGLTEAVDRPGAPADGWEPAEDDVVDGEIVEDEIMEVEPAAAPVVAVARPSAGAHDHAAERRRRRFRAVILETYPSVAEHVLALAEAGADAELDDWLEVARLLSDDVRHRNGGLSAQARQRALEQTVAAAIEAQARSSARLAGYPDDVHDDPSPIEGDPPGMLLWEHYVVPEARLALQSLHGEALGNWLDALNELWESAHAVYTESVARAERERPQPAHGDPAHGGPAHGDVAGVLGAVAALPAGPTVATTAAPAPPLDAREAARVRLKAALVAVEELSLW
ncbi:MAG TPA: hypothetical protein VFC33_03280 [Acidimicrobiia bacterium]|nr:hypothetical protein [Acidimicrobiia bacterium]